MRLSRYGTKGKREDWEHESYQPPQMGSFSFENDFVRQLLNTLQYPQPPCHRLVAVLGLLGTWLHSTRYAVSKQAKLHVLHPIAPHNLHHHLHHPACHSHYCLNHHSSPHRPPPFIEKLSSVKPVLGAKKVEDCYINTYPLVNLFILFYLWRNC